MYGRGWGEDIWRRVTKRSYFGEGGCEDGFVDEGVGGLVFR